MLSNASNTIQKWLAQSWLQVKIDHIVLALACSSSAAFLVLRWMRKRRIRKQIQEASKKRDHGLGQMEKAVKEFKQQNPGIQTTYILSLPLAELAEKLKEGSLSPESVLYTYMEKALTVTQEVNCVRHFIPECEQHLQELKKQKQKGLLYGIPVSIKDHIGYKGHLSTCGFIQSLNVLQEEDSVLVKVLKRQGANPFVFTNVSQSLYKTPGGSSGGEGALIAGGGSILGFGSDIGGSIRLPSSFCGICGLKPTGGRLSNLGVRGPIDGILSGFPSLTCPRSAGLQCPSSTASSYGITMQVKVYSSSTPLRIGYFDTDGYFLLPSCMKRAIHITRKLLQEAGHMLVPFTPPSVDYAMDELYYKGVFADGGSTLFAMFEKDIVDLSLKSQVNHLQIPNLVKKVLAKIIKPWFPRLASHLNALCGVQAVNNLWEHHDKVMAYRQRFADKWKKYKLDVILCPVLGPAFTLGYPTKVPTGISSTMLFNVLNFPAGVVPVTTVTEADEEELKEYQGLYGDPWDKKLKEAVEGAVGLPVAVQCVALPWQDELCLRFMKEVETLSWEGRQKKAAA